MALVEIEGLEVRYRTEAGDARAVDGVPVRCVDGVHLTVPGGEWVGSHILPQVVSLGQAHASTGASQARPALPPQPMPVWYPKLPCGS